MNDLSIEDLEKQYRNALSDYRYYTNTDDLYNWQREKKAREAARNRLDEICTEYKRRKLPIPYCP